MGSPFDCIHTGGPPVVVVVSVVVVEVVAVAGLVLCVVATDAGGCFSPVVGPRPDAFCPTDLFLSWGWL